jgi:NAD(P)-dependent dehydrogenase (short-subunit alcohol dehydrogenase family)
MKGKTCVVTGANAGLGYETALELARQDAAVIMVCRSEGKAAIACKKIRDATGNKNVRVELADLSSQSQIRDLGDRLQRTGHPIDVLVNNAGLVLSERKMSEDQVEMVFAVNHLGPFLLTHLLLPQLTKAPEARIVNVSSANHYRAKIDFEDLFNEKSFNGLRAYGQSKLANVLFTYELDRRLKKAEYHHIATNALDPGLNNTNIGNKDANWLYSLVWKLRKRQGMSPQEGAKTQIHLASSPVVRGISGLFWQRSKPVRSSKLSYREEDAKRLWKISLSLCNIESYFP